MGIDITGWVEVNDPYTGEWDGAIRINYLVGRTYHMFALLFGVKNGWKYRPMAQNRGIPTDASTQVILERGAAKKNGLIAPSWIALSEIQQLTPGGTPPESGGVDPSTKEALTPGWQMLFELMEILGHRYGARRVRLVVWFTNDGSEFG
jgi:hypothetical protein